MASSSESHGTHDLNFPVEPMTNDKALEAALPGEAEVVAWRGDDAGGGRKFTAMSRVSEIWADQCLIVTPLVTLASLQAMQARAEAAEARAHTASLGWADALNDLEAAEARVKELQPILDWAAKQRRKPYSVTMLLDALKGGSNG